jgi:hypothetical protein
MTSRRKKARLSHLLEGLSREDLRTLRAMINGRLGKRSISPEQQEKMQEARKKAMSARRRRKEDES